MSAAFPSNFHRDLPEGGPPDTVPQCILVVLSLEHCSQLTSTTSPQSRQGTAPVVCRARGHPYFPRRKSYACPRAPATAPP